MRSISQSAHQLTWLDSLHSLSPSTFRFLSQYKKPDTHLATIEAIYHFFRQLAGDAYRGELDNLLFWFVHQWELIERTYDPASELDSDRPRSRKIATSAFARNARRPPEANTGPAPDGEASSKRSKQAHE